MADIIIAFPKINDAKNLRRLLIRNGYDVNAICDSGAEVMEAVNRLDGGVVISGYRFSDMYFMELKEYLPKGFQPLLLASPEKLADSGGDELISLAMPFKMQDLLTTLDMMLSEYRRLKKKQRAKPPARSEEQKKIIAAAKELLMERNQLTEEEAHHYIQRLSMDSGNKMVETAEMIIELNGKEWNI